MSNSNSSRRRFLKISATGVVVAVVAGIGGFFALQPAAPQTSTSTQASRGILEKAREEGTAILYSTWDTDTLESVRQGFIKKHPQIKAEFVNPGAGEVLQKYLTERRVGKDIMDAFVGSAPYILPAMEAGMLDTYISPEDAYFKPEYKDPNGLWTSPIFAPTAIAYNTDAVKGDDIPKTYWDLVKPKFKDRIAVYDPHIVPAGILILKRKVIGADRWMEYLRGLQAVNVKVMRAHGQMVTMLKTGEIVMGGMAFTGSTSAAMEQGAPIDYLRHTLIGHFQPFWINKFAPHPNAARILKDYFLSLEGETILTNLGRYPPLRNGVESKMGINIGSKIRVEAKDVLDVFPYTQKELDDIIKEWDGVIAKT